MKSMCYRTKITVSSDGELTCCECDCKVGGNKDLDNATLTNDEGNCKADARHKDKRNKSSNIEYAHKTESNREEKDTKQINKYDKNMVFVHVLPDCMKLSMLLLDFLADDVCFELASILRRNDGNATHSDEENILIKECLIT